MKRLVITSILGVVAASASTAFGQGYIIFGGGPHTVWDFSLPTPGNGTSFDTTFLWSSTATVAAIDSIAASTPTNGTIAFDSAAAWADFENVSGGWQFAVDAGTGTNVYGLPGNLGSFTYDNEQSFALSGSTGAGEEINIYVIAWETDGGLYTTLAAAEAGDAAVGWSSVFGYTLAGAPPGSVASETVVPAFGFGAVPEPATLALAGLGGLSMIFLRCRKANSQGRL